MSVCGEPHPDDPTATCILDHSTEEPPQDHLVPGKPGWVNQATEEWLAKQAERPPGRRTRRQIMLDAKRTAKPDDRVGPYGLDAQAAMAGANAGLARAEAGASSEEAKEWLEAIYQAILQVASRQSTVHVDDVWVVLGTDEGPCDGRASGAPYKRAQREGVLVHSGLARRTKRANGHHHWRPVWRSLIFKG